MSKSTKIIAGLGIAATLGVAAVPVATFAETTTNYSGSVGVSATIADQLEIKIDGAAMATGVTPTQGTAVIFKDGENTSLSAGKFYTAGATTILISTNVPNTYTLAAKGTVLSSGDADIAVAGTVADDSKLAATAANASDYSEASMWGIKVSATDKAGSDKTLTDGSDNTVFNGAEKYLIGTTDETVDYAEVTSGSIKNTYTVNYGLGINENQSSGTYAGTATYTVTHVKGA